MTEQEEKEIIERMRESAKEYLIDVAKTIKGHCINHQCEECPFYTQKEPPFVCKISDGLYFTPEEWEV